MAGLKDHAPSGGPLPTSRVSATGAAAWMIVAVAGPVLGFYLLSRWLTGHWDSPVVPAAAVLAMLSEPTDSTTGSLHSVPVGLMAVIGSFLLFGLGTFAALTKHRWNRTG